ncbi:tetratricopeptide repeat protein [Tsuneonella sp. HG094]
MGITITRAFAASLALAAMGASLASAQAQDAATDARLKKAESEIRALQRKVFPGDSGKYFEPQITAAQPTGPANTSAPSTTAVTDILARLDAMESQIARLTSQTEENSNAIRQLGTRLGALEVTSGAAATSAATTTPAVTTPGVTTLTPTRPATVTPTPTPAATRPAAATPTPAATRPSGPTAQRLAAVQAIAKPQTDDAADDEYSYGFRLWDAKFYPEAQQQLSLYVEKYPNHRQISYGRNLLGRAYLDDGKAKEAAPWFLKNYQSDKQGARAPDSLLFLGETMIAMKDTKRACIALAEFAETYPAVASGRLKSQYDASRAKVKCN